MSDLARLETALNLCRVGFTPAEIARRMGLAGPAQADKLLTRAFRTLCRSTAEQARAVMLARLDVLAADLFARINPLPASAEGPRPELTEAQGRAVHFLLKCADLQARVAGIGTLAPVQTIAPGQVTINTINYVMPALPEQPCLTIEHKGQGHDEPTPQQAGYSPKDDEMPDRLIGATLSGAA